MLFEEFFRDAKSRIAIVGTHPLVPDLQNAGARLFTDLLIVNNDLHITILAESDSECFNQSLCVDTPSSGTRRSFSTLKVHRDRVIGKSKSDGLLAAISSLLQEEATPAVREGILKRIRVRQLNLRLPLNIVLADGRMWFSVTTQTVPTLNSYQEIPPGSSLYSSLLDFVDFYINPEKGGIYLSKPREDLIQMYDREGIPRGIYPRDCFYTTEYERYSIWGFVFNREGELLLHQRSPYPLTRDGAGLWDKSVGGHVDLSDSSTSITAERELIEEMFLPEAEYTKYIKADLGDIVHFGEWSSVKRPEHALVEEILGLAPADWVMFRATDSDGQPLTVSRVSDRRFEDDNGVVSWKRTVFRSDVYLFIAPWAYLDNEDQMHKLLQRAEGTGAATAHKLVTLGGLRDWITDREKEGRERDTFTDDILFINLRYRGMLEGFAEFVKLLRVPGE